MVNKEYDSKTWGLPGGGWDHGETEHETFARELKEEVGYEGDFTAKPFATQIFWLGSKEAWLLWIVYEVETKNSNFSVGEYSTEIAFIRPDSLSRDSESLSEQWIRQNL